MTVCRENLHHAHKLQKRDHNKGVKPKSYAPGDKVWLNNKYLKTKQNRKLEAKFLEPFWVIHLIGKQAYKLEFLKKWIHNVFHMSLLKKDITRKEQVDKKILKLDSRNKDNQEYKVEAIRDSTVYAKELESHLSGFY